MFGAEFGFFSIWPALACVALLMVLGGTPLLKAADTPPGVVERRLAPLDGLRGILALSVFFHHTAMYHVLLTQNQWGDLGSQFYASLGPFAVFLFFMITGYLFWGQMLDKAGKPDWIVFVLGRIFRIGPLYVVTVAIMLGVVACMTGFELHVPLIELIGQVAGWLMLGVIRPGDVNGLRGTDVLLVYATWSVKFEWAYYRALPFLAFATRNRKVHLSFVVVGLSVCLFFSHFRWTTLQDPMVILPMCFALGMLCASLKAHGWMLTLSSPVQSVLAVFVLASLYFFPVQYAVAPVLVLGVVFYLIVSGCTMFGFLVSRPARRMGNISYGIFLMQGLVLAPLLRTGPLRFYFLASPAGHFGVTLLCGLVLIAIATVAHVTVERPGIAYGKKLAAALKPRPRHRTVAMAATLAVEQAA